MPRVQQVEADGVAAAERDQSRDLLRHYVGGAFRESVGGGTFETLNPATNEPIADVADGGPEDVDAAVRAARQAFDEGPWPRLTAQERAEFLRRIAGLHPPRGGRPVALGQQ